MSNSSPSPQQTYESDVVCGGSMSLNQEALNQPDAPPPEFDAGKTLPPQPVLDPEDNHPDEEEDDDEDGGEINEGQEPETLAISSGTAALHVDSLTTIPHVSVRDVTLMSPSRGPNTRRGPGKRKKGKGKPNIKKQQAIEEKIRTLMAKLNPIPFIPNKILDFNKHEELLKKLGLWDFVNIDFDRKIRVDLIAQLIATYDEAKLRGSYVNDCRIAVSRADLARAFKLPIKKRNTGGMEVDLEKEPLSDDSIGFIIEFVSDWMLLHDDDAWMMPDKVSEWFKEIRDGRLEKVDWASLFWFMVKEELKQGGQLRDCYYASHLQHLIRCQREELFSTVKLDDGDVKEEGHEVNEGGLLEGPSTELKLGQDGEKEEGIRKDVEMLDVEKCKDSGDEEEVEREEEEEQGQWLLHAKNEFGEHFMRRCSAENAEEFKSFEEKREEEEEIEEEDRDEDENKFHVFPSDDALEGDGYTGNLLQAMETTNQMDMRVDLPHISSTPTFFNNTGKRVIEHDGDHLLHHANESNKKLRINDSWDHNKHVDFGTCMEQIHHVMGRAKMLYEEKEQAIEHSNMNQQILLAELQKRDAAIEHLHRMKLEEIQRKDGEIYRLERELYLMGSVLGGYRKALKEVQRAFAEYREKARLPEEPTYKDVGTGGLMLTGGEIEKLRKKREEEYKMFCLIAEQKMKEFEGEWACKFNGFVEKVDIFELRLTGFEADCKGFIELFEKRKTKKTEEEVSEAEEESVSIPQAEEKMCEVEEDQPNA